jgi:hypothetical protein
MSSADMAAYVVLSRECLEVQAKLAKAKDETEINRLNEVLEYFKSRLSSLN